MLACCDSTGFRRLKGSRVSTSRIHGEGATVSLHEARVQAALVEGATKHLGNIPAPMLATNTIAQGHVQYCMRAGRYYVDYLS